MEVKSKHPGGRPGKYEEFVKPRFEEILAWSRAGATDKEIAENLGIHKSIMCEYKKKHQEFNELLKNGRKHAVLEIKAALFKRATGCHYSEKKTIVEYEEWSPDIKEALEAMGYDTAKIGQRKMVRMEIYDKYALPDPASAMILLKHWDKEEVWTSDPAQLKLKQEELELKKQEIEKGQW